MDDNDLARVLTARERFSLRLRDLYQDAGYRLYRMSRFEEYALYQENRRFLDSGQVLTFTDLDGRLMALKPDVTLSIAKNAPVPPGERGRFYYHENVYRPGGLGGTFQEIDQMGVECIGAVDAVDAAETLALAAESLALWGRPWILEAGHMGFDPEGAPPAGDWDAVLEAAVPRNAVQAAALAELRALGETVTRLAPEAAGHLRLDLSLSNGMEYYHGLVFQGFLEGLPRPVLRGGRYDSLASRFRPGAGAVGFALYLPPDPGPAQGTAGGRGLCPPGGGPRSGGPETGGGGGRPAALPGETLGRGGVRRARRGGRGHRGQGRAGRTGRGRGGTAGHGPGPVPDVRGRADGLAGRPRAGPAGGHQVSPHRPGALRPPGPGD